MEKADQKKVVYIFHLQKKDGTPLFLHPFGDSAKTLELMEEKELKGRYGREPRVESLTMYRNILYRSIEDSVNEWIAEKRFLPKFLVAAAMFLAGYLFFSLVIRDPLPVLDEIALAIAGGVGIFFLMGRKDKKSDPAMKKRIALRTKADRIVFESSRFVRKMEEILLETGDDEKDSLLNEMISPPPGSDLLPEEEEEADQFIRYLQSHLKSIDSKKHIKVLEKFTAGDAAGKRKKIDQFASWIKNKKGDLSLHLLYVKARGMTKRSLFDRLD